MHSASVTTIRHARSLSVPDGTNRRRSRPVHEKTSRYPSIASWFRRSLAPEDSIPSPAGSMIMLKSIRRLWWNGVKRIGRAQQSQNKKLLRSLLKVSKIKPIAKPKAKSRAKPRTSLARPSRALAKPVAALISSQPDGLWGRSYHSSTIVDGIVPLRRMEYWLYVPDGVKKSSMPLVVMLHGCEQSATQFAQGTRMNLLASKKGFAVLYPQQSSKANSHRCWNWYDKATQDGAATSR